MNINYKLHTCDYKKFNFRRNYPGIVSTKTLNSNRTNFLIQKLFSPLSYSIYLHHASKHKMESDNLQINRNYGTKGSFEHFLNESRPYSIQNHQSVKLGRKFKARLLNRGLARNQWLTSII